MEEVKVIEGEKKQTIDEKIAIKELEEKLEKMAEDKDNKCKAAREQLVSMLEVTVDKYRTATGTAEALRVLRFVLGDSADVVSCGNQIDWANRLAWDMAEVVNNMCNQAKHLPYDEMDKLCAGFYDEEFKTGSISNKEEALVFEMMSIDLCRNVGGAAEDMVSFIHRVDEEIEATQKKLDELKAGK